MPAEVDRGTIRLRQGFGETQQLHRVLLGYERREIGREQLEEPSKSGVGVQSPAQIGNCARDVSGEAWPTRDGNLVPERPERLQVTLHRHQVEAAPEISGVLAWHRIQKVLHRRRHKVR